MALSLFIEKAFTTILDSIWTYIILTIAAIVTYLWATRS